MRRGRCWGLRICRVSPSNSRFPLELRTGFQIARTCVLPEVWSVPLSARARIDGAGRSKGVGIKTSERYKSDRTFDHEIACGELETRTREMRTRAGQPLWPSHLSGCNTRYGVAIGVGWRREGGSEPSARHWYKPKPKPYKQGRRGRIVQARQARRRAARPIGCSHQPLRSCDHTSADGGPTPRD